MKSSCIDIDENELLENVPGLLEILLKDMTTGKNILWGTDDYLAMGENYAHNREMKAEQITGENGDIIKPRIAKSKEIQQGRVRNKGEVFTAAWVCNY